MKLKIDGYNCSEYLDEYYSFGLFNPTEAQMLYSPQDSIVDNENGFLRIGEIYDDHDAILGYKMGEIGIWGRDNSHWDGTYQVVSSSLEDLCEGWYQRDSSYWCAMDSEKQWNEISNFLKINIHKYKWEAEKMKEFVDYCLKSRQLTEFYIKAYNTLIGITLKNGFCSRSFTNMVNINYDYRKHAFIVGFKNDFFDGKPKIKEYEFENIQLVIKEIDDWIKNIA
jgi:hypothetical protein